MNAPITPTAMLVMQPRPRWPVTMPAIHAASSPTTAQEMSPIGQEARPSAFPARRLCGGPASGLLQRPAGLGQTHPAELPRALVELPDGLVVLDQYQLSRHVTQYE